MVDFSEFKRFCIYNMIGSLILCAAVAVISVLVGSFTETAARAIYTLFLMVGHSLVALLFIWDDEKQGTFNRLSFFINTIFVIIILSFLTSVFGVWEIVPSSFIGHAYTFFFILGFAALHADILSKALGNETYIDNTIYVNFIFMIAVVLMLLPVIFITGATNHLSEYYLGEMFFRILTAIGIIDGTLSILTIIFYRLHMHKYPKSDDPLASNWGDPEAQPRAKEKKGMSIWVWILLIYLLFQIVFPVLFLFFGMLY